MQRALAPLCPRRPSLGSATALLSLLTGYPIFSSLEAIDKISSVESESLPRLHKDHFPTQKLHLSKRVAWRCSALFISTPHYRYAYIRGATDVRMYNRTNWPRTTCFSCLFFDRHFSTSSNRKRFNPSELLDKQAVVTDVCPSPPRYVPSFLWRIGFSIPIFQLFMLADLRRTLLTHDMIYMIHECNKNVQNKTIIA